MRTVRRQRVWLALLLAIGTAIAGCSDDSTPEMSTETVVMTAGSSGMGAAGMNAGSNIGAGGAAGSITSLAGAGAGHGGAGGAAGQVSAAGQGGTGGGATGMAGSPPDPVDAGDSDDAAVPTSGDGGSMDPAACVKGTVQADEVVFIGESFIALSGAIPRFTTALARAAGTIGASESYRSYAVSGTQLTTGDIPGQFTRAVDEGPVKAVLMDGGGNDLLQAGRCQSGYDASCQEIVEVVLDLFAQMKAAGVTDVVYFFYPDPMGIGASIKDAMDILRPEMKKACDGASDVRCVWVDQRETWDGHYDAYTSDGIHPTDAGSMASAMQIWEAMVANCIAQ